MFSCSALPVWWKKLRISFLTAVGRFSRSAAFFLFLCSFGFRLTLSKLVMFQVWLSCGNLGDYQWWSHLLALSQVIPPTRCTGRVAYDFFTFSDNETENFHRTSSPPCKRFPITRARSIKNFVVSKFLSGDCIVVILFAGFFTEV